MKIALLSGEYPPQPGGVGDYTRHLGAALRARGHRVDALTIQNGRLIIYSSPHQEARLAPEHEQPRYLDGPANLNWSPRCWPVIINALDNLRPDWLHIQYQTGAYSMRPGINLLPWRLRALRGRPRIAVTFHDLLVPYLFPKAGRLRNWVNIRLARDADALVATNSADAEQLAELGNGQQVTGSGQQIASQDAPHGLGNRQQTPGNGQQQQDGPHRLGNGQQAPGNGQQQQDGPHRLGNGQQAPGNGQQDAPHGPGSRQQVTGNRQQIVPPLTPRVIPIGSNIPVAPPIGYHRATWRAELGVAAQTLLVAYFGLFSPSKGPDLLITALASLELPWRLLLIGGAATASQDRAYAEALQAQISRLGLAKQIISTGHVGEEVVSAHLLAADLAALPFRDGASLRRGSLLAVLAHGCPLVTTTPADAATTTLLAPAALLSAPGDANALGAALSQLAASPALRTRLAAAGPPIAARFSWPSIAAQHEQLYLSH